MRFITILVTISLVLASLCLVAKTAPKKQPPKQKPAQSLPTLVDFGAEYCPPCRQMKPELQKLAAKFKGKLTVIIIDIEKDQDSAAKFKVENIPTQVFFDKNGKVFYRHEGYMSTREILDQFKARGYDLEKK